MSTHHPLVYVFYSYILPINYHIAELKDSIIEWNFIKIDLQKLWNRIIWTGGRVLKKDNLINLSFSTTNVCPCYNYKGKNL